jgi:hypothetical protein
VQQHAMKVDAALWSPFFAAAGLQQDFTTIFGGSSTIWITRSQILAEQNQVTRCLLTLLWGYPSGKQNRGHEAFLANVNQIATCTQQPANDWNTYWSRCSPIAQLGISTISKLAYFGQLNFSNCPAVILDRRIIAICRDQRWVELARFRRLRYDSAPKHYVAYITELQAVATGIQASSEQVELFLFSLGGSF